MALDSPTLDQAARRARRQGSFRACRRLRRPDARHRPQAWPLQGDGGPRPVTGQEVARTAGCAERYVREWLNGQAAGGYVVYHAESQTYELTPEQAFLLADEKSPVFMPPIWEVVAAAWGDEAKTIEAIRTGTRRQLGRARRPPLLRCRGLLPQRLPRKPRRRMAAGA